MEYRKFSRVRWLVRVGNVGLIAGLVLLIVYNCHPMPAWLIVLLVVTGVLIVWGGRMFCGYACPVGLTLDALWALSKKLKVRSIRRSDRFNRFVKGFKYFFLVFYTVLHFVLGIDPGWFLVFVLVALFALLGMKRSEQNRVWVGLSKETAHQLGTPISSLMAWSEILQQQYPDDALLPEMDKDVKRLQMIAERFSKIGSTPELASEDINALLARTVAYMQRRTSGKVQFVCNTADHALLLQLNGPLFEWVIENLFKNAVDAMNGEGVLTVDVIPAGKKVMIDVTDTGKGIAKSHFNSVFSPGFTTKQRGWGLGLSLAKRIVEEYHKGKIYVRRSEVGKGTTFRIELKRGV